MITASNLQKNYKNLLETLILCDPTQKLSLICSEKSPQKDALIFISNLKTFEQALLSKAGALVVPSSHSHLVPKNVQKNIFISKNPRLAMAIISKEIFSPDTLKDQIKEASLLNTFIHPTAEIGANTLIGPNSFIGKNVKIGDFTSVGASVIIQENVKIGSRCKLHELSFIGKNCELQDHCEVYPQAAIGTEGFGYATDSKRHHHPIPHQGKVILEEYVHVGSGSKIDRGTFGETLIKKNTKIDNLCHIAHNCVIGKNSLITAGFMMAGSTTIGDNFTTGGRATVAGHIEICDDVHIAGLSSVNKSVKTPGSYYGRPLRPLQEGIKNNVALGRLSKMRKDLKKVLKKLDFKEST